jgi:hypothetical protein
MEQSIPTKAYNHCPIAQEVLPPNYTTRTFITLFTKPQHMNRFSARCTQCILSYNIHLRFILILYFHCVSSRKVAGSIPDGDIRIFH